MKMKLVLGALIGSIIFLFLFMRSEGNSNSVLEEINVDGTVPMKTEDNNSGQSLLSPEEELLTDFFGLINSDQIPDAIALMSDRAAPDDSAKQAWGVQFNAVRSVHVLDMEEVSQDTWKVTLEIYVDESAADAPIPYYGWEDNPNIRFITVVKDENGVWKIDQIGTGY